MLTKCSAKWAEGPRATHFVSMTYEISKSRFGEPGLGKPAGPVRPPLPEVRPEEVKEIEALMRRFEPVL